VSGWHVRRPSCLVRRRREGNPSTRHHSHSATASRTAQTSYNTITMTTVIHFSFNVPCLGCRRASARELSPSDFRRYWRMKQPGAKSRPRWTKRNRVAIDNSVPIVTKLYVPVHGVNESISLVDISRKLSQRVHGSSSISDVLIYSSLFTIR